MTNALLRTVAIMAIVIAVGGVAQANDTTGQSFQQPQHYQNTTASTTWMYSSLCKAAVPVKEVYHYEGKPMPATPMMSHPQTVIIEQAPLHVYPAHDYNYAP